MNDQPILTASTYCEDRARYLEKHASTPVAHAVANLEEQHANVVKDLIELETRIDDLYKYLLAAQKPGSFVETC